MSTQVITCIQCLSSWTGLNSCHCSGCHRTFADLFSFDYHRRGFKCAGLRGWRKNDKGYYERKQCAPAA